MNRFYPRLKILFAEPLSDFTKGFLPQIIHDGTVNLFNYQEKNAIKIFYLRSILFIYLDTLLTQCYEDSPMPRNKSKTLYQRARKKIPGGVNSPVRAWQSVGGTPAFIARGRRAYLFDTEG